jgi:hydrogenase maturation protease
MLILGLGNLLLADEGVGVHAARMIAQKGYAETVVLDIGTAVLDALPALETAQRVIIIDALKADGPPGSVYRIPYDDCLRPSAIASMHGFDLSRVLAMTGRRDRPEIIVIGVEPARIDWSMDLSAEVTSALPAVLRAVENEIMRDQAERAFAHPVSALQNR